MRSSTAKKQQAMVEPKVPVFIDEHGDLMSFQSVHNAEGFLEPIDVNNNDYVGYDAEGYLLSLRTQGRRVIITLSDPPEQRASELEQILRRWLVAIHDPLGEDARVQLATLVSHCAKRAQTR